MSDGGAARVSKGPSAALDVLAAFLLLGMTAFGGSFAHVAVFRREFVERRGWLDEDSFAQSLAFAQAIPGVLSAQLAMAIGRRRAGGLGALAAGAGFLLPAGVFLIAFTYIAPQLSMRFGSGWILGLKVAAAGVVIQAVAGMARRFAPDPVRAGMALGAAVGLVMTQGAVAQVMVLVVGALFGWALLREEVSTERPMQSSTGNWRMPLACATALLVLLPVLAVLLDSRLVAIASVFHRIGLLMVGGDHMLLPLLRGEVLGRSWIATDGVGAAYGLLQAMPGPMTAIAGFAGAQAGGWQGGVVALAAILTPGLLLTLGLAPIWDRALARPAARGAALGLGAVATGSVAAALWDPLLSSTIRQPTDWALVASAFVFLAVARLPPWIVVLGFASATGLWIG